MRLTYTQAYQHLAVRNREGEGDLVDKFFVIGILRTYFNMYGLTGEVVKIDDDSYRLPDILVKGQIPIVIELDGGIHGNGDKISKPEKDTTRDDDYRKSGVKLIIINYELTDHYQKEKVIQALEAGGLRQK